MIESLRKNWYEYLIEGCLLGLFMVSAGVVTILLEYSGSPLRISIENDLWRRLLIGIGMGLTAIALILSPWGKRSGAHMNPAVTLAFLRLRKIKKWDAIFYVAAQFIGGFAGLFLVVMTMPSFISDKTVNYIVTIPGPQGEGMALGAEFLISFILMLAVLMASNTPKLARFTPVICGILIAAYVTIEAPFSGMSMNPARTFGSALNASLYSGLWIYFVAPVLAMQLAAWIYQKSGRAIYCCKFHHHNDFKCMFHCAFDDLKKQEETN